MTTPDSSSSWFNFRRALTDMQRAYEGATAHAARDIDRRLQRFAQQASGPLDDVRRAAMKFDSVRSAFAVQQAIEGSERRAVALLKSELAGLDFSDIWAVLWEVAKEVALYVGGGAVIGGAVGGIGGAFAAGAGAIPGAIGGAALGAQIGGEILVWMGLGSLVVYIGKSIPEMCKHFSEGFALAWRAGSLPQNAHGQYASLRKQATESFAQGKLMLVKAILCAIVLYLTRGQASKSLLFKQIGNSKLGPKFAQWVAANEGKLLKHPALQPKIGTAEAEAKAAAEKAARTKPAAKEPARPAPEEAAAKNSPAKNGRGKACANCPGLLVGHPVNPISGAKILAGESELDFAFPAVLPVLWQRTYSSQSRRTGWLGQGWSLPYETSLRVSATEVEIIDAFEREVTFSLPQQGQSIYSPFEKITLERTGERQFELSDQDGLRRQFTVPATGGDTASMTALIDRNGNAVRIEYSTRQQPERIVDSAGREYVLAFVGSRLASVAQGGVAQVLYEYDAAGDLAQVRNRIGDIVRSYDYRNHILVEHAAPGGLVSRYEYDEYLPQGRVLRNWINNGQSWAFVYRPGVTVVTDNLGRQQQFRFDDQQQFTGYVDPAGGVLTRRLDGYGNLTAAIDAAGRKTGYRYDARARMVRIENSAGNGTGIVYHPRFDKPALVTDALGATTALRYDERGNLASVTDALGRRTSYLYDDNGLPVKVTDARGGAKKLEYNRAGQLTAYTDCSGNTSRFTYDGDGNLIETNDAEGHLTRYRYDALGRLLEAHLPGGGIERYEYDNLGRMTGHVDPAGRRTCYTFDADGKPLTRLDARGGKLEYRYDAARRMAELINENGDIHAFVYDALDRIVQDTGFDTCLTRYRYDGAGLLAGKEEHGSVASGENARIDTTFLRNHTGLLEEKLIARITGPAQAEQLRLRFAYDAAGRMVHASNHDAEVQMEYDLAGQLLAEQTHSRGDIAVLRHTYDELGNRTSTMLPDGRVLNHLFHGSGHLHQINIDGDVVSDFERDGIYRETSRTQGALTSRFRYDEAGRLADQSAASTAASVIARSYQYDAVGNLLTLDDSRNGRMSFDYDVIGRILAAVQPQLAERFAFDPAHNIVDPAVAGGRVEANRVTVFEDKRYRYDPHGNVMEKLVGSHTRMQFEWNGAHQLIKSTVARGDTVQKTKYVYDPFGRRIAKRDAFGVTRFVWDGNRLLCELRGAACRTYLYEPWSFVPLAQVDSVAGAAPEAGDKAQVRHIHTDHLGTPRELTDSAGRVTWAATYRAWGNVLKVEELGAAPDGEHLAQMQPIRFQGQYHDIETGLHYNRFRYYDPDVGRFVSHDPIGLTGGFNNYQYAPNPVSWIDPSGLSGRPIVVIGEGQRGVNEAARQLKSSGYRAESMMYPKVQWPRDLKLAPGMDQGEFQKAVQWNKEWLMDKIRQGYQVVDIGPDGRAEPSEFYKAEREAVREMNAAKMTLKKLPNGETVGEMRTRICKC